MDEMDTSSDMIATISLDNFRSSTSTTQIAFVSSLSSEDDSVYYVCKMDILTDYCPNIQYRVDDAMKGKFNNTMPSK